MVLESTDRNKIKKELLGILDQVTSKHVLALSKEYYSLEKNKRSEWLAQFKNNPSRQEEFEKLTHYWANVLQLTVRSAIIASENQLEENRRSQHFALKEAKQSPTTPALDINPYIFTQQVQKTPKLEELHTSFSKETIPSVLSVQVTLEGIHNAIQNAARHKVPAKEVVKTIHAMLIELIHTEHPTNPLSKNASNALKAIRPGISDLELLEHIKVLSNDTLVPHSKRTVGEEVNNDIEALKENYDNFVAIRHIVHKAFKTYYKSNYVALKDELDEALGIVSPSRVEQGKIPAKGIIPSGGWAGFDADGNTEMTPEETLQAIQKRRIAAAEKHASFIEKHVLPWVPGENLALIHDLGKLQHMLQVYAQKVKSDPNDLTLTKPFVQAALLTLWKKHEEAIRTNTQLDNAIRNFAGQLQNFGLGLGRGDIRQKSYLNTKVLNAILEDHKKDPEFENYAIFQSLRVSTFEKLPELEKLLIQEQLLNGSVESKRILEKTRQKFEQFYYDTHKEENKAFKDVHDELRRMFFASRHTDIIQKYIISNTEHTSDLLTADILQEIFGVEHKIDTMPLLESIQDLDNLQALIEPYIQMRVSRTLEQAWDKDSTELKALLNIEHREDIKKVVGKGGEAFAKLLETKPELRQYLASLTICVMAGPSDSSREGSTAALVSINEVQPKLKKMTENYGVQHSFFYGIGADIGRGSESQNAEQQTAQGNFKHNMFSDAKSQLRKTDRQFSAAFEQRLGLSSNVALQKPLHEKLEEYKNASKENYEFLYNEKQGFGKLMSLLYGISTHHLVTAPNNYSSRATILGKKDSNTLGEHPLSPWEKDSDQSIRPGLDISIERLRAITKTWDDEVARHFTNIIYGPGFGLEKIGKKGATALYERSPVFRDIMDKTAVGLALSDFAILWENFPPELRPIKLDGNIDMEAVSERAARCRSEYPALLQSMNIPEILAKGGKSPEFKKLIEMVVDLTCMLYEEQQKTQGLLFEVLKPIHLVNKPAEEITKPTDILFYRPELQQYYEEIREGWEPLSKLNSDLGLEVLVHGKGINTVYPKAVDIEKHQSSVLDTSRRLVASIAVGGEAARTDVPQRYDRNYLDLHYNPISYGVEWASRVFGEDYRYGTAIIVGEKRQLQTDTVSLQEHKQSFVSRCETLDGFFKQKSYETRLQEARQRNVPTTITK